MSIEKYLQTEYLPALKEQIMGRDGKLVIRPDSGNPVDIICGTPFNFVDTMYENGESLKKPNNDKKISEEFNKPEWKGVIELLWDAFGGTVNEQGYKVLDPHIGCIYGDGIGLHNLAEICERLKAKGFASTNVVFGFGSYGYQYNTRDTFGFAMKATYGEITTQIECGCGEGWQNPECNQQGDGRICHKVEAREIFKDPITDDGTKKSKKGLLRVVQHEQLEVVDQQTWAGEEASLLTTVFKDGQLIKETTLTEIRKRLCQ